MLESLALGFSTALTVANLGYAAAGVLFGTLVGVLPGLGPVATIAMLLPFTYALEPASAVIMLAGIYYGAQYGGSTTAILLNLPGEASAVVTCLDGHRLARAGRAATALSTAAVASFLGGTLATAALAFFAPLLAEAAFLLGPADYCALMILGLTGAMVLAQGSLLRAFAMTLAGLLAGLVGTDLQTGALRYTFGSLSLQEGLDFAVLSMGIYGVADIIVNVTHPEGRGTVASRTGSLCPRQEELRPVAGAALRGTVLGTVLGALPGGGALLSAFASYTLEKKFPRGTGEVPVGEGNLRGVAGPEAANNAGAQTSFIPLLTLGIPPNAVMAMMAGALMLHDMAPGPAFLTDHPDLFWGLVASMWIGNVLLLFLNLPLAGLWASLLKIPYRLLFPAILLFCAAGVLSLAFEPADVLALALFGLLGLFFAKTGCEGAPFLLGFLLGPLFEEHLRRALLLSHGDFSVFLTSPVSAAALAATVLLLAALLGPNVRRKRDEAFGE